MTMGLGIGSLNFRRPVVSNQPIFIKKGMGTPSLATLLEEQHVIPNRWLFIIAAKLHPEKIKAGEYLFKGSLSANDVLTILVQGVVVKHVVTIPEGLTSAQVLKRLRQEKLLQDVPADETGVPLKEGIFLPESYAYEWGDTFESMVKRLQQAQGRFLGSLTKKYALPHPLKSVEEAVILASIIEKETALAHELPHVASVFLNRLRIGMPLQADPTVLYGAGVAAREPSREELKKDTPYNTYLYGGLPPGPVCNPGKKALQAVFQPLETNDLYFVADGHGGHVFASSLAQHQKHHVAWREKRQRAMPAITLGRPDTLPEKSTVQ